jgi:GNAT superfamily N-acetyltransferase
MKTEVYNFDTIDNLFIFDNVNTKEYYNLCQQLKSDLKYFSIDNFNRPYSSDLYEQSKRFIICHNSKIILGICEIAMYDKKYISISNLSVNKQFQRKGISKLLLNKLMEVLKSDFKDITLTCSQWSVSGWKYLRNSLLNICKENNINFTDNKIGFCENNEYDEMYQLIDENKEHQNKFNKY